MECICNSCKKLKSVISEDGNTEEYECEFGYPSIECENCLAGECDITCEHYVEDKEEFVAVEKSCKVCGKTLIQSTTDEVDDDVYCIDCYLNNINFYN